MEYKSVNKLLEESFKKNWERPALSNYHGVTLTYETVAKRIKHLHITFEKCGLQKGDKVAICSRNQANWGVCFLAALTYGAVPVPILHEFKPGNIHYLVNHSEAKVFFVDEVLWESLSEAEMPGLYVIVQMNTLKYLYSRAEDLQDVRDNLPETFAALYPNGFTPDDVSYYEDKPDELAIINYTSGTSGFSKGVMIPYRALYANIKFAHETAEPSVAATQIQHSDYMMHKQSILKFVRATKNSLGSNVEKLYKMADGRVEALEFYIQEGSPVSGVRLSVLDLKPSVLVAGIVRDGSLIIPTGADEICPGDSVIIITTILGFTDVKDILK